MFQDVLGLLGRMGLKPRDGAVYVALLHHREGMFVHEIVTQTKIKRSTVDVVLTRLQEVGFVQKIKTGARYRYLAKSPEAILFHQEQVTEDFKSMLPILTRLGSDTGETEVRFFEGAKGIAQIHDDMLLRLKFAEGDRRQLISFSSGADVMKLFPDMQKIFIDKRIKMGVPYRAITPMSAQRFHEYATDAKSLREAKFVDDKKFPFKATFETYADSLMICSYTKPVGGVVIRNMKIADSMRSLFTLVWSLLP